MVIAILLIVFKNIILIMKKIYKYIQSMPYPEEWLSKQVERFNVTLEQDFSKTVWGKLIIDETKETIEKSINTLNAIARKLEVEKDLIKWYSIIRDDIEILEELKNKQSWDSLYSKLQELKFKTWTQDRKLVSELKDTAKQIRDKGKEEIDELKKKISEFNIILEIS